MALFMSLHVPTHTFQPSCCLQSFLTKSEAAFRQHPVWASAPPAHQAQAVEVRAFLCMVSPVLSRTLTIGNTVSPHSKAQTQTHTSSHTQHPHWVTPQTQKTGLVPLPLPVQGLEKYLMTKIYHKTFGVSELDRERDEALSMRMAALGFIKPAHLDIPELYQDEKAWVLAMKELHKINNYKVGSSPSECFTS